MKKIRALGIRNKFLFAFFISLVAAMICIVSIQTIVLRNVGLSEEQIASIENNYSFIYFVLFIMVTLLFFRFFTKNMITRIERIHEFVNQVKNGDFEVQISDHHQDELGHLAGNINDMVRSLNTYMERERKAEQMKNEVIMSISHDLRTPLTSLSGFLELIKKNENVDPEARQRYTDISLRKCRELTIQINQLLEYSSLHYGEMGLNREVVGLKELIEQVIIDNIPQLERNEMTFHIESEQQKIVVEADISLILRLFQNIISNAIQYGNEGKTMHVIISTVSNGATVQVVNYGNPIAKDDIPYIFDKFYRAEKSRSLYTGGKGLGLAIAKRIAELHDGQIEVHSDSESTTFSVFLPKAI